MATGMLPCGYKKTKRDNVSNMNSKAYIYLLLKLFVKRGILLLCLLILIFTTVLEYYTDLELFFLFQGLVGLVLWRIYQIDKAEEQGVFKLFFFEKGYRIAMKIIFGLITFIAMTVIKVILWQLNNYLA